MPVVTHSKARLGQPSGLLVSSGNGEGNHPKRVIESRQGNEVVAGHEELRSPTPTYTVGCGNQSSQRSDIFKCKG